MASIETSSHMEKSDDYVLNADYKQLMYSL